MASRTVPALVALLLATTACTGGSEVAGERGAGPSASPSGATPGGGPSRTVGPVRGGPLGFDGSGRFCSSHPSRDFVYGDDILDTVEPIEIESLALVGASGVRIVDAWVMPVRGVPLSGDWAQWPLPRTDLGGKVGLEWNEREPAEGAFLDPGTTYNLIVRMRRPGPRTPGGFKALAIEYRTSSTSYVRDTHTRGRFKRSCF